MARSSASCTPRVAAGGGKVYKTEFCRTHAIPARLFNALACDLQGLLDGTREVLKERRKDLTKALARQKKQLATRGQRLAEAAKDRLRMRYTGQVQTSVRKGASQSNRRHALF